MSVQELPVQSAICVAEDRLHEDDVCPQNHFITKSFFCRLLLLRISNGNDFEVCKFVDLTLLCVCVGRDNCGRLCLQWGRSWHYSCVSEPSRC